MALINRTFIYKKFNYDKQEKALTIYLKKCAFDVAFHRLGLIIRKDLIDCFSIGIINDHWGLLPFIRGRNSIDYSIIMGIPLCATTHFIEETIDTGQIITIHQYQHLINKCKTLCEIRKKIKNRVYERINDSIMLISKSRKALIDNDANLGLTYYSIHPHLRDYIEFKILKKSAYDINSVYKK